MISWEGKKTWQRILIEDYQKALKGNYFKLVKLNFIFSFEPNPFNEEDHKKQKRPETSDQSLIRLQNKFRKIPWLVIYYLTYLTVKTVFELFQKLHLLICPSQFMISQIIPLSFIIWNLESMKRKRKNYQKFEYLENEERFLDQIKYFS